MKTKCTCNCPCCRCRRIAEEVVNDAIGKIPGLRVRKSILLTDAFPSNYTVPDDVDYVLVERNDPVTITLPSLDGRPEGWTDSVVIANKSPNTVTLLLSGASVPSADLPQNFVLSALGFAGRWVFTSVIQSAA